MYRKILVPVDLSEKNLRAVDIAARLAEPGEGSVQLIHVIEMIPGFTYEQERDFYSQLERRAREHLSALGDRLEGRGIRWQAEVAYGSRAPEILRLASDIEADLLVVSSHRVTSEKTGQSWGTLSYHLAILASCTVLLVK